jgi:chaperonin cofactor prefoldin
VKIRDFEASPEEQALLDRINELDSRATSLEAELKTTQWLLSRATSVLRAIEELPGNNEAAELVARWDDGL